jgi:hypothetical protein
MKPQVRVEDFLDWLFSDSDDAKQLGVRVVQTLKSKGTFTITTRQLFEECGYIPVHILDNKEEFEDDDEFEPNEVELINYLNI